MSKILKIIIGLCVIIAIVFVYIYKNISQNQKSAILTKTSTTTTVTTPANSKPSTNENSQKGILGEIPLNIQAENYNKSMAAVETLKSYSKYVLDFHDENNGNLPNSLDEAFPSDFRERFIEAGKGFHFQYTKIEKNGEIFEICSDYPSLDPSGLIPKSNDIAVWNLSGNRLCVKFLKYI